MPENQLRLKLTVLDIDQEMDLNSLSECEKDLVRTRAMAPPMCLDPQCKTINICHTDILMPAQFILLLQFCHSQRLSVPLIELLDTSTAQNVRIFGRNVHHVLD